MTVRMSEEEYQRLQSGENRDPELGDEVAPYHKRFDEAVGIDPGAETGVAWTNGGQIEAWTTDFWGIHDTLRDHANDIALQEEMVVFLEAPYLSRPGMRTGHAAQAYRSGGVARSARLLKERLEGIGYTVVEHDPAAQGETWTSKTTRRIVGDWLGGEDNEHVRDAIRLLFFYNFT